MSPVEFKKRLCRPAEFKGQGPPSWLGQSYVTHRPEAVGQVGEAAGHWSHVYLGVGQQDPEGHVGQHQQQQARHPLPQFGPTIYAVKSHFS